MYVCVWWPLSSRLFGWELTFLWPLRPGDVFASIILTTEEMEEAIMICLTACIDRELIPYHAVLFRCGADLIIYIFKQLAYMYKRFTHTRTNTVYLSIRLLKPVMFSQICYEEKR